MCTIAVPTIFIFDGAVFANMISQSRKKNLKGLPALDKCKSKVFINLFWEKPFHQIMKI